MFKYKLQRKLINFATLLDLIGLMSNYPYSSEKIKKIQGKKIRKLMERAYEIPFYRKKFESIGLTPADFNCAEDLAKFPTTSKEELRKLFSEQIQNNPQIKEDWIVASTSGSTGSPLIRYIPPFEEAKIRANWIRMAKLNGFNPFTGMTVAMQNPGDLTKKGDSILQRIGLFRRDTYSYTEEPDVLARNVNESKPDFLYANKSVLLQMALYAQQNNIKMYHPKCYASIGEAVDKSAQDTIIKAFGNGFYDTYGCTEASACMFQEKGHLEHHIICHDTHIINLYNEKNQLCDNGRLILTNLFLKEMPIINFDVNDSAESYEKDGLKYVRRINGRLNDWFIFEDGYKMNYQKFGVVMQNHSEVAQFRFIQHNYHEIVALIALCEDKRDDEKAEIKRILESALNEIVCEHNASISVEMCDRIPPDENGKLRIMVSKIKE